eukprot:3608170-Pleurochrysis_carterae.AAC.1
MSSADLLYPEIYVGHAVGRPEKEWGCGQAGDRRRSPLCSTAPARSLAHRAGQLVLVTVTITSSTNSVYPTSRMHAYIQIHKL